MSNKKKGGRRKNTFAKPLIILTVIVLATAFSAQTFFVTSLMRKKIGHMQMENFLIITSSIRDLIELEISGNEHTVQGYAKSLSYIFSTCALRDGSGGNIISPDQLPEDKVWAVNNVLETIAYSNPLFETVFMCDVTGRIMFSNDEGIIGADISGRDYFQNVVEGFETTYTTPDALLSKATGNLTIVHAVALVEGGENLGLLGASLNLNSLGEELILNKKIGETGYPYLLDRKGIVLIHPSEDLLYTQSQDVDPFFQIVVDSKEEAFTLQYSLGGTPKNGAFVKIPNLGWTVCLAISEDEAYSAAALQRNILALSSAVLVILVNLLLMIYIRRNLLGRVKSIESLMSLTAEGDLTNRGSVRGRDEIADMSHYFNTLLDSLSRFFIGLGGNLQNLEDVGVDLSSNMEETAAAVHQIRTNVENSLGQIEMQEESVSTTVSTVEEITQNIRALDRNIERQNEKLQQGSSAVEEMIAQIKTVSASTSDAEKLMDDLTESSRSGRENLQNVSAMVEEIVDKSRKLEQANALITGIAARTNLLAMNAAIEAAHAGQAGRGFSVVADEIRKLAEQSTIQSSQVKQTINDINGSIMDVVQGSQVSNHSFEEIQDNIAKMGRITNEIQASMEEQVAGSTQMLQSLEDMKSVGGEVRSGSEEMTRGNRSILDAVSRLTQISSEVSQAIREIDNGMNEINNAVAAVADLTRKNRDSIDLVRSEAAHYRTGEEEQKEDQSL